MSLIDSKTYYKTIKDAIITLLRANMAALNTSLTEGTFTANTQIVGGNPITIPVPLSIYPIIMVDYVSKTEDFLNIGNSGRKRPTLIYRVFAVARKTTSANDANDEIGILTGNIEGVFRDNIDISGTVLYSQPINADFGLMEDKSVYVNVVAIDLQVIVEIK